LSSLAFACFFGFASLAGSAPVSASDVDDVKSAVNAYHGAIAALDISKIEAVWAHDDAVLDKEPTAKTITVGWEGTRKNFEGLVAGVAELAITQTDGPHVQVEGDLAWSAGISKAESALKNGQRLSAEIVEADVFKKQSGQWLLVSHITSVMPPAAP
jgi:ketosteroid isomerase-like protein